MENLKALLVARNFTPGDHKADFGEVIPYVTYAVRKNADGTYLYVSLITYSVEFIGKKVPEILLIQGEFVEAVVEIYLAPKNSKKKGKLKLEDAQKMGFTALSSKLLRSKDEVRDFINNTL